MPAYLERPHWYLPKRQKNLQADADCPAGVLAILDSGPRYADRFTVVYAEPIRDRYSGRNVYGYRGMCANPCHPQGIGMYGELGEGALSAMRRREKRLRWSELPEECRRVVRRDLQPEG